MNLRSQQGRRWLNRRHPLLAGARVTWFPFDGVRNNTGDLGGHLTYNHSNVAFEATPVGGVGLRYGISGMPAADTTSGLTTAEMGISGNARRTVFLQITNRDRGERNVVFGSGTGDAFRDFTFLVPNFAFGSARLNFGSDDYDMSFSVAGGGDHVVRVVLVYDGTVARAYIRPFSINSNSWGAITAITPKTISLDTAVTAFHVNFWPNVNGNDLAAGSPYELLHYLGVLGGRAWTEQEAYAFLHDDAQLWREADGITLLESSTGGGGGAGTGAVVIGPPSVAGTGTSTAPTFTVDYSVSGGITRVLVQLQRTDTSAIVAEQRRSVTTTDSVTFTGLTAGLTYRAMLTPLATATGAITLDGAEPETIATVAFDGSGDGADTVAIFGHSFPQGAIPDGAPVLLRRADTDAPLRTQIFPLTRWPDESVRTASFAAELPALGDGVIMQVRVRANEAHSNPGADLTWSGALSGRSILIKTWTAGNTITPDWTFDVAAALTSSSDDWMAGPLALCRRVKVAVPSTAVRNTSGNFGTIETVRLVVDVTATKDGMILVDAGFFNDRVNHAAGGHARFGWIIEIDGTIVYDQRPATGVARDLIQYNAWIKRRGKKGATVYNFYDTFRPLFRPDPDVLVRSHFLLAYDTSLMTTYAPAAGMAERWADGSGKLNDPYWNWGLFRFAGNVGGRAEIGYHTAECVAWMVRPNASRVAERLAHLQAEAYGIAGWLYYDHELDRPIMVDEWPRFALHFSYNIPAPNTRALATGPISSQPRVNNVTDHIQGDQEHRGNFYAPTALLGARRMMYDMLALRSCEATLHLRHEGWRVDQGSFSDYGLRSGYNWTDTPTPIVPDVETGSGWVNAPWAPQNRAAAWGIRDLVYADYLLPTTTPRRSYYTDNLRAWINCYNHHLPNIKTVLHSEMDLVLMHGGGFHTSGYMYAFFAYGFAMAANAGLGGSNAGTVISAFLKHRALGLDNDLWARRDLDGQDQYFFSNGRDGGTKFTSKAAMFAAAPAFPEANWANSSNLADYQHNAIAGAASMASANLPMADRAMARDLLVRWRSERRQASGNPATNQLDFSNADFPQTNLIVGSLNWSVRCDTAPVIVAGQSFSAATSIAANTIIGIVEFEGCIPRCSVANNATNDAFEITSQPAGNPFTISKGGVIRRSGTGTFPSGPSVIQIRARTYNDAGTLLQGSAVDVTIVGT